MTDELTGVEGASLVRLARAAIEDRLERRGRLAAARESIELTDGLAAPRSVFVTLFSVSDGARTLRGCIGSMESSAPAVEAVVDAAIHAAFHDPRFTPLTVEEYPTVAVLVSALSPPSPVESVESIVPGEHGVSLEHPRGRSVFLPEVAAEHGWTRDQLLAQLCLKASLPEGAWREGRLFAFRSQKFGG